jgi:hypothetical protein
MMRKIFTFFWVVLLSLIIAFPAQAFTCRTQNDHRVCIISIKRSAKNHWEYWASVSIDGTRTPAEIYNCRRQVLIQNDGRIVPFGEDNAGEVICSFFKNT